LCFHALCVSSPSTLSSANCNASFASCIARTTRHPAILLHHKISVFADIKNEYKGNFHGCKAYTILGIDPPRGNTCDRSQQSWPEHPGMNSEIIDTLLTLFDKRIPKFPNSKLLPAIYLFSAW
jgi:hypothetical protein